MPPKPFKPPRPTILPKRSTDGPRKSNSSNSAKKPKSAITKPKSKPAKASISNVSRIPHLPSLSPDSVSADSAHTSEISDNESLPPQPKPRQKSILGEPMDLDEGDEEERQESIPEPLLSVLLHSFLAEQGHRKTRISRDANRAVGKYMDTFVRETLARAAWSREEAGEEGGFLEVEDLEKLAPQLLMDF